MVEKNMLVIIDQYKEKMMKKRQDLASIHRQALRDEQAKVLVLQEERKEKEEVMEQLHEKSMKWMNKFTLTLNESQELLKLLARARAIADMYSTTDKVHNLFDYYQHMIKLMIHIIRNQ